MTEHFTGAYGRGGRCAVSAVVLLFFLFSSVFLAHQDIWVDETTQLSGLTLSPVAAVSWLCGQNAQRFGVPGDRMPPLSYWTGWLWSRIFGLSETSMRIMGVAAVACAALLIAAAGRKAWGPWAGVLAAAVFMLSPNTLVTSVEIRAYPLFLLTASATAYFLVCVTNDALRPRSWYWIGLTLSCMGGILTHFYGVVVACAILAGLAAMAVRQRECRRPLLIVVAVVLVSFIAIIPFILGASQMGGAGAEGLSLRSVAKFAYRAMVGHPSLGVYPPLLWLGMAGFAGVILGILFPRSRGQRTLWVLVTVLIVGSLAAIGAKAVVGKFDALSPSYNLWRLPVLCLVAGSVAAIGGTTARRLAIGTVAALITAGLGACLVIIGNADIFAHTPHSRVVQLIRDTRPQCVVYDGTSSWASLYFPLYYSSKGELRQALLKPSASGECRVYLLPAMQDIGTVGQLPDRVLLVAAHEESAEGTAAMCAGQRRQPAVAREIMGAATDAGWVVTQTKWLSGQASATCVTMQRGAPGRGE